MDPLSGLNLLEPTPPPPPAIIEEEVEIAADIEDEDEEDDEEEVDFRLYTGPGKDAPPSGAIGGMVSFQQQQQGGGGGGGGMGIEIRGGSAMGYAELDGSFTADEDLDTSKEDSDMDKNLSTDSDEMVFQVPSAPPPQLKEVQRPSTSAAAGMSRTSFPFPPQGGGSGQQMQAGRVMMMVIVIKYFKCGNLIEVLVDLIVN